MRILLAATALVVTTATIAAAAADPVDLCRTGKQAAAAKYVACRARADKKLDVNGSTTKREDAVQKCREQLRSAWAKLEASAVDRGATCPTTADEALIENLADVHAHRINHEVSGRTRFVDNGDGTISDRRTGLMWEKKNNSAALDQFFSNPHGAAPYYYWAAPCDGPPGCQLDPAAAATCTTGAEGAPLACGMCSSGCEVDSNIAGAYTAWTFVNLVNAAAFGGHSDWRIPTFDELRTLLDLSQSGTAVNPAFNTPACATNCTDETDEACSCTFSRYLTASVTPTSTPAYTRVWTINFDSGATTIEDARFVSRVRLVRGTCLSAASGGCD